MQFLFNQNKYVQQNIAIPCNFLRAFEFKSDFNEAILLDKCQIEYAYRVLKKDEFIFCFLKRDKKIKLQFKDIKKYNIEKPNFYSFIGWIYQYILTINKDVKGLEIVFDDFNVISDDLVIIIAMLKTIFEINNILLSKEELAEIVHKTIKKYFNMSKNPKFIRGILNYKTSLNLKDILNDRAVFIIKNNLESNKNDIVEYQQFLTELRLKTLEEFYIKDISDLKLENVFKTFNKESEILSQNERLLLVNYLVLQNKIRDIKVKIEENKLKFEEFKQLNDEYLLNYCVNPFSPLTSSILHFYPYLNSFSNNVLTTILNEEFSNYFVCFVPNEEKNQFVNFINGIGLNYIESKIIE